MQACASIPHSIACLGFPRASSSRSTSSIIMVKVVLACAVKSAAPSSGTVGPRPLGYCSVRIGGIPRIRLAQEELKDYFFFLTEMIVIVELQSDSIPYLQQSRGIADNVCELEDVGSELFLHVTEEKHCILGAEPTNSCHCKNKVTRSNLQHNNFCKHKFTLILINPLPLERIISQQDSTMTTYLNYKKRTYSFCVSSQDCEREIGDRLNGTGESSTRWLNHCVISCAATCVIINKHKSRDTHLLRQKNENVNVAFTELTMQKK